jgi:flavin-dependent dehydrogenase
MNGNLDHLLSQLILEDLKRLASDVLGKDNPDTAASLPELGFGLQTLTLFIRNLNQTYGLNVAPTVLLQNPSLATFASYLFQEHRQTILTNFAISETPQPVAASQPEARSAPEPAVMPETTLQAKVEAEVIHQAAELLKVPAQDLNPAREIIELGFNSGIALQFAHGVSTKFEITIHPGIFFEYTTLKAFSDYLLDVHQDAVRAHYDPSSASSSVKTSKETEKVPVIIGTGITGLLISRALTKEKIHHVMLGDPMISDTPKLGESMNESASIDLLQEFSEFKEYFFDKKEINFYSGNMVALLNLRGKKGHAFYDTYERLGFNPQTEYASMIHIDRLGFDRALYEQVSKSSYCKMIPKLKVSKLDFDEADKTIHRIHLEDGQELTPSYVFDATNHVRLLGRMLGIEAEIFNEPRDVFFTHYGQTDESHTCDDAEPWQHATNILRLEKEADGMEGIAWCIPEGSYISVGISIDSKQVGEKNKDQILDLLDQAYKRRGLDYRKVFNQRREVVVVPRTRHFIHKQFVGKNWLMAGGSACQIWYPSGSNISISLLASKIAPKLINDDASKWLQIYQQITTNLAKLHWSYDRWTLGECKTRRELGLFARDIYSYGNKRMAIYASTRNGPEYEAVAKEVAASEIPDHAMLSQELRIISVDDLQEQTQELNRARASLMDYLESLTESTEESALVEVV